KKPSASNQKPECPAASRSASPRVWVYWVAAGAGASRRQAPSGTSKAIIRPSANSADDQPNQSINPRVPGNMANWPNDPAAAAIPMAMRRFSGVAARPTAASNTEKDVPDNPRPINTPALMDSPNGVSDNPISTRPDAYRMPPITTVRPAP